MSIDARLHKLKLGIGDLDREIIILDKDLDELELDIHQTGERIRRLISQRSGEEIIRIFPESFYSKIKDGEKIDIIDGKQEIFKKGETDNEARCGYLPYGIQLT